MTDQQKSIVSLALLKETCDAALSSIAAADGTTPDDLNEIAGSDFAVIHKDFLSLLSLLYSSTTKIALSLKPSSPTYSASLAPLKDISTHVSALSQNVRLVKKEHGLTLLKELQSVSQNVVYDIQQLAQTLLSVSSPNSPDAGDKYLAKTGAVHHAIQNARSSGGLSSSNHTAVLKICKENQASLADALKELQEISTSSNEPDDFGDGWDELGIDPAGEPSEEELDRLKKIETTVKLSSLLHKNLIKQILSLPLDRSPNIKEMNPSLDTLALDSTALGAAADGLISAGYPPQDANDMSKQLSNFSCVIEAMHLHLDSSLSLLPVESILKEGGTSSKPATDLKKLFNRYFDQVATSIKQLSTSLPQ